jgi:hypothetical protein
MYIPCEVSSWTLLHQNRKLSSRISLQNRLFCLCRLPAVWFAFLLLEYCKIRECYAVANAFTIKNMYSLLLYMNCNSRKSIVPRKTWRKLWHSYISKLFLTKMQIKLNFQYFFIVGVGRLICESYSSYTTINYTCF